MATADQTYIDPSALASLYIHEPNSRLIAHWRMRAGGPVSVTHYGKVEVINTICRAIFSGRFDQKAGELALRRFGSDFVNDHLRQADILWRAALDRAAELSKAHTQTMGTRSLDVLHVACALELKMRYFLTFDVRQQKLASAAGLKLVRL